MKTLGTLIRYELVQLLRDHRTVLLAVVLPVVLLPALLWVANLADDADEERVRETTVGVRVTGPDSGWAAGLLERALSVSDSAVGPPLRAEAVRAPADDSLIGVDGLHLVVAAPGRDEEGPLSRIELRYRASSDLSRSAANRLEARLERVRVEMRDSAYAAAGLGVDPDDVLPLRTTNVASAGREAGAMLGTFLLPVLVAMILTGGSLVAADTLSGEKERGSLETLLTTSVSRNEVVVAKGVAIGMVALVMTVVNVTNLGIWVGLGFMELPAALDVELTLAGVVGIFALLLPVIALLSAILLLVSGWADTYREYQLYFLPVFVLALFPSLAAALPGLELRTAAVLVPLANVALAMRELLAGRADVLFSALSIAVTSGAAAGVAVAARSTLSTERLLADSAADRAEFLGGPVLFPYRVLRWFGLMWVVLLGLSLALGEGVGLRGQVLTNLLGLFLGSSILMIWRYRLPVREALALRPVPPAVWLAVLVGAPSGYVVGVGLARFTGIFLPVPPQVLEAFGQFLVPEGMGVAELVLLLAVLPGITEEIAFRGVLLHGLRRRLGVVALCLVVGGIFGLFHVSFFRILPTAYLGTVLALVTIFTGSIFPAMLWHALNNAVALVPLSLGWTEPDSTLLMWAWPLAAAGLVTALVLMRRVGEGYPGVTRPEVGVTERSAVAGVG